MHVLATPRWNDRLPSACAALALQAGLLALLASSFRTVTEQAETQSETIFLLPRPMPRAVTVIDARQTPRAAPAPSGAAALSAPEIPPAPPPYTQAQPDNAALFAALRSALACEPDAQGRPSPLVSCRKPQPAARDETMVPAPALPVAREAALAVEHARAKAPMRVPCVSMQSRSIGIGSMNLAKEHALMVDPLCAFGELVR